MQDQLEAMARHCQFISLEFRTSGWHIRGQCKKHGPFSFSGIDPMEVIDAVETWLGAKESQARARGE